MTGVMLLRGEPLRNSLRQSGGNSRPPLRLATQGSAPMLSVSANTKNQINSAGFVYDAAGNLLNDGAHNYQYDPEGRIRCMDAGANCSNPAASYVYSVEGRRVKRTVGGATTLYLHDGGSVLSEFANPSPGVGTWQKDYIYLGGALLATESASDGTRYHFSDHLGTPRVITDAAGNVVSRHDYYPYGTEITAWTDGETHKFTGKERDAESGLDYFGARYYGSNLGRFASADYFLNDTHVSDPQSWNLYTYVRNNPLKFIDPTGEKVYVGDLGEEDRKKLLERANATYGCESCVTADDKGFLQVDTSGLTDAVRDATGFLTDAINSETYFANVQVTNNDSSIAFGKNDLRRGSVMYNGVRVNADLITLDFGDDRHISGDALAKSTFLNTVFAHEIRHGFPTIETDPRGSGTGPVVDAVNRITDALGLPRRISYATQTVSGFSVQRFSQRTVDKKGRPREQILQILWRRENTGGGNR
jgi:RHS repeat-associated protein